MSSLITPTPLPLQNDFLQPTEIQLTASQLELVVEALLRAHPRFRRDAAAQPRALALLLHQLQILQERILGESADRPRFMTKIPAALFRDFAHPNGGARHILEWSLDSRDRWPSLYVGRRWDLLSEESIETAGEQLLQMLRSQLVESGIWVPPLVYVWPTGGSRKDVIAANNLVEEHGGQVAPTPKAASHIVFLNSPAVSSPDGKTTSRGSSPPHARPARPSRPSRTSRTSSSSQAVKTAALSPKDRGSSPSPPPQRRVVDVFNTWCLWHWNKFPDSYDRWEPAKSPEQFEELLPPADGRWKVSQDWLQKTHTYNEWMNPVDFLLPSTEWPADAQTELRQSSPSTSPPRKRTRVNSDSSDTAPPEAPDRVIRRTARSSRRTSGSTDGDTTAVQPGDFVVKLQAPGSVRGAIDTAFDNCTVVGISETLRGAFSWRHDDEDVSEDDTDPDVVGAVEAFLVADAAAYPPPKPRKGAGRHQRRRSSAAADSKLSTGRPSSVNRVVEPSIESPVYLPTAAATADGLLINTPSNTGRRQQPATSATATWTQDGMLTYLQRVLDPDSTDQEFDFAQCAADAAQAPLLALQALLQLLKDAEAESERKGIAALPSDPSGSSVRPTGNDEKDEGDEEAIGNEVSCHVETLRAAAVKNEASKMNDTDGSFTTETAASRPLPVANSSPLHCTAAAASLPDEKGRASPPYLPSSNLQPSKLQHPNSPLSSLQVETNEVNHTIRSYSAELTAGERGALLKLFSGDEQLLLQLKYDLIAFWESSPSGYVNFEDCRRRFCSFHPGQIYCVWRHLTATGAINERKSPPPYSVDILRAANDGSGLPSAIPCMSCGKLCLYTYYRLHPRGLAADTTIYDHLLYRAAWCVRCFTGMCYPPPLTQRHFQKVSIGLGPPRVHPPSECTAASAATAGDDATAQWTADETEQLLEFVETHGESWTSVAAQLNRTPEECVAHFIRLPIADSDLLRDERIAFLHEGGGAQDTLLTSDDEGTNPFSSASEMDRLMSLLRSLKHVVGSQATDEVAAVTTNFCVDLLTTRPSVLCGSLSNVRYRPRDVDEVLLEVAVKNLSNMIAAELEGLTATAAHDIVDQCHTNSSPSHSGCQIPRSETLDELATLLQQLTAASTAQKKNSPRPKLVNNDMQEIQ